MIPMTPHPAVGQTSQGTGDLNLAAALMAVGIPLDPTCECVEVHRDRGHRRGSYGRFHFLPQSTDGKYDCHLLSRAWSGGEGLPKNHPFQWIMDFIDHGREQRCSTTEDWLGAAHDHCRDLGLDPTVAKVAMKPDKEIQQIGESREAYIFAFVSCREVARKIFNNVRRNQVMMSRQQGGGITSHVIIDTSLPTPQRNELLARLEGA